MNVPSHCIDRCLMYDTYPVLCEYFVTKGWSRRGKLSQIDKFVVPLNFYKLKKWNFRSPPPPKKTTQITNDLMQFFSIYVSTIYHQSAPYTKTEDNCVDPEVHEENI